MEAYFEAKARLFTPELSRRAAVGIDGPEGRRLAERGRIPSVTFGFADDADVRATDIEVSGSGLTFSVGTLKLKSRLRGRFNVAIEDTQRLATAALRHRIVRNFDAEANGITTDAIIKKILEETSQLPAQ